jgi:tetratricopeptide (TPR) repeat protein
MKIIEKTQHRCILRWQKSLWCALLINIIFIPFGSLICWLGFLFLRANYPSAIIAVVSGLVIFLGGIYTIIVDTEITTYTFDKAQDSILWEKQNRLINLHPKSVEFPCHLICGVEIESFSGDEGGISYYPRLILASIYWRITLKSDGDYESAISIAKMMAEFLDIPYFDRKLPAPTKRLFITIPETQKSGLFYWQYLENEVENLQQNLANNPDNAEAHQDLGIALYYLNRWQNRKQAVTHLQEAERLFESAQDSDSQTIAKMMKTLVSWNYV